MEVDGLYLPGESVAEPLDHVQQVRLVWLRIGHEHDPLPLRVDWLGNRTWDIVEFPRDQGCITLGRGTDAGRARLA